MSCAEQSVLLYDEDCGFCRWSLDKILAWDRAKRVRPVAIQNEEGSRLLASIPPMPASTRGISPAMTGGSSRGGSRRAPRAIASRRPPARRRVRGVSRSHRRADALTLPASASGWRGSCASTQTATCVPVPDQTSSRAKVALATLVAGYFALAVVAGAPNSPLTVLLPNGAAPPTWARFLADAADLANVGRRGMTAVAWVLLVVAVAAFAVVVFEAWSKRIRLAAVLTAASCSLLIAVAGPGRSFRGTSIRTRPTDASRLSTAEIRTSILFRHSLERFVAVTSVQWLPTHSNDGPLFTLASAGLARAWAGSMDGTILAFKVLAGVSIAAATGLVALTARKIRPERAALAAGLVGLNPVIVVHTVGGGHVDALIAAPLAAACALVATGPPARSARAFAITILITLACLTKTVILPVLRVWFASIARPRGVRDRSFHLLVVAALTVATAGAFFWRRTHGRRSRASEESSFGRVPRTSSPAARRRSWWRLRARTQDTTHASSWRWHSCCSTPSSCGDSFNE